jgi:hypothetical protein
MSSALLPQAASVMLAGAMVLAGVTTALSAASVTKRLIGLCVALIAALLAAAAAGAPTGLIVGGVALVLAYGAIGAALLVRLQEAYATSETSEVDAADTEADTAELGA